ncbi:GNAT family N-acetyltransferase [Corallococcus sp. M34]|uniref:GNAT family N-acetyltransferase n=1 Tax=Citreicoccus inhibens TaxID=2849499 RepID=UPI001C235FFE|nr:GNAT family N-acetyltransferase [Citreicoccus inhibens]MBU8895624.1 GNAT family N-acetyltransferase [Citreicoccus inhibens]
MTDAELTTRLHSNLLAFKHLQCERGLLRHLALPGLESFALPSHPHEVHFQQVLFAHAGALDAHLPALTAFYRGLGIPRWRITVLPGEPEAVRLLEAQGYRPSESLCAMGRGLEDVPAVSSDIPVVDVDALGAVVGLNAEAYGEHWRDMLASWERAPRPPVHAVVAREAGRGLACGVALDTEDLAGIYLVATAPAARKRGLASAVMQALLAGARARGRVASALHSTPSGHSVYLRLGYRDLGPWWHWVPGG